MSLIVTYAHRYKRAKRKPQPAIGPVIVTAPKPKRRRPAVRID